ncbi:hypothetical protein MASR2M78_17530 [Treponema sp.]
METTTTAKALGPVANQSRAIESKEIARSTVFTGPSYIKACLKIKPITIVESTFGKKIMSGKYASLESVRIKA